MQVGDYEVLDQGGSGGAGEKWLDSRDIWKAELSGSVGGLATHV